MLIENGTPEAHRKVRSDPWSNTHFSANRLNWAAAILRVVICVVMGWALIRDKQTVQLVDNTREVALLTEQLISSVMDAETGQRGFLITGDEIYLAPFRDALSRMPAQIVSLRRLTEDNAQSQQLVNRFATLSQEKFLEMGQTITLRRERGEDAARTIVANNTGEEMMNQLRALAVAINSDVEMAAQPRIRKGRNNKNRALAIAGTCALLCVCCVIVAMRTRKRIWLESEQRFHIMADFIPPMGWIADKTGWIFWYNQRWYDYTGTTSTDMERGGWQTVHDPERLPAVQEMWSASIISGQPFQMEMPLLGADGTFRMFLTRVVPWKDKDGNISRWFGTNTDINDLTLVQKELRKLNEQLEIKIRERTSDLASTNKELESFAYSVSHDLRAPLRHLDGFADLLRKSCYLQINSESQRYMDKITASAQTMGHLIDDLLEFSRLLRSEVSSKYVNLNLMQEEVRRDMEPDLAGRSIVWKIGDLPEVYGDRSMLRQVFTNLLSNAVKYTRNRPEAHIEIGCAGASEDMATVFVRDNGVGFEMDYVHKLFGVFQRLHSDEFEGTGVGLAIVRRVIDRHGGRVWAEGVPDQGATFYCSLRTKERKQA